MSTDREKQAGANTAGQSELIEPLGLTGTYRVDNSFVEHGCCWDSAIVRDCKEGLGMYGNGIYMVCECDSFMAEIICNALNSALRVT